MKKITPLFLLLIIFIFSSQAQVSYTANDSIIDSSEAYGYGTNAGWFPPHTNVTISDLAAGNVSRGMNGAGCKSIRGAIPDDYVVTYGLNADYPYWTHNINLGLVNNAAFIGYPHSSKRATGISCPGYTKQGMFTGLYLPIWDGGLNGTAVNENNTYAKYVWDIVHRYKDYVKYWEIWNEPDFTSLSNGWRAPGDPLSWWNRSNFTCDINTFNGTIFEYIRMMRVSWQVIKSVDPTARVCTGGIGYESFLDACLRYTDNPVDGSVTTAYPLKGGAYFDVLSYHVYPQYEPEVAGWNPQTGTMTYNRHSDGAADAIIGQQNRFKQVLNTRGYNGTLYPKKLWIVTEQNIARKLIGNHIGGETVQRNYTIKAHIIQQQHGILQTYVYGLAEKQTFQAASSTFDAMGLYQKISGLSPYQPLTSAGTANRSMSQLLYNKQLDSAKTADMLLPASIKGAAFCDTSGQYTYVLWAKTQTDRSEAASASYSFPANFQIGHLVRREWNFAQTSSSSNIPPTNLTLNGTPSFFTAVAALPVGWGFFHARLDHSKNVILAWQTTLETNNQYFSVERSQNGREWKQIFKISSKGNSTQATNYEVTDLSPLEGRAFYRIKQIDFDGVSSYTNIQDIYIPKATYFSMEVFPKPLISGEALNIKFQLPQSEKVHVAIQSMEGKIVKNIYMEKMAGKHALKLDIPELNPGIYFLHFEAGGYRFSDKLQIK